MKILQAIVLSFISFVAFAQDSNIFESVTLDFKLTKPAKWQFATAAENLENLKKVQLSSEELRQYMLKYATAPLVVITKYPEPFDDLNPSFKVNIKPLGQLKGADPKKILELILPQFQNIFQDFNLIQPPSDTTVGRLPAAYMRINYSLVAQDERTFPTTSELWIVPRGDYFFMIGAGTRQDEKTGSREEIAKIMSSIEL